MVRESRRAKRFAGETGRCVPGRNNAQDFARHTRSYHEPPYARLHAEREAPDAIPRVVDFVVLTVSAAVCLTAAEPVRLPGSPEDDPTRQQLRRAPSLPKPPRPLPRANIRVDTNVVLIPGNGDRSAEPFCDRPRSGCHSRFTKTRSNRKSCRSAARMRRSRSVSCSIPAAAWGRSWRNPARRWRSFSRRRTRKTRRFWWNSTTGPNW